MSMDNMEAVIDLKLKALHSDVSEIKSSLSMLAEAESEHWVTATWRP